MSYSASVGCGCCGNGLVAFVLAADGQRVVLFCLNCGTWYHSISLNADGEATGGTVPEGPDLILTEIGASVRFPATRWATPDDVRAFGWGDILDPRYAAGIPRVPEEQPRWERRIRGELGGLCGADPGHRYRRCPTIAVPGGIADHRRSIPPL